MWLLFKRLQTAFGTAGEPLPTRAEPAAGSPGPSQLGQAELNELLNRFISWGVTGGADRFR